MMLSFSQGTLRGQAARATLSLTMNGQNEYILLNGHRMSEFMLNAYTAAYYNVPVVLVTGDQAICDHAKEIIPAVTTVPVHRGCGGGVFSLHPAKAQTAIEEAAYHALSKRNDCHLAPPTHFEATVRFRRHQVAYVKQFYPGATLTDGKNVSFLTDDWYEMLRFFHFVL